jgi:putative nucleotidyltransferase with HDIG domain
MQLPVWPTRLPRPHWSPVVVNSTLLVLLGSALVALLLLPLPFAQIELRVGQVAPRDIVASQSVTYESALLTQQARERAAQSIPDYYDAPEIWMRRQQVNLSRDLISQINLIREGMGQVDFAQVDEGILIPLIERIQSLEGINISAGTARQILEMPQELWMPVAREIPILLDQAMQDEIRESNLNAVRRRIPSMISSDLNEVQSEVVAELVRDLVRPNSFHNEIRTQEMREQARQSIPIQTRTLERGEIVLRAGDIVRDIHVEALNFLGLTQEERSGWQVVQAVMVAVILLLIVVATIYRLCPHILRRRQESGLLITLAISGLIAARLMIVPHDWLPYLFPLAAVSMLASLLLDVRVSIILVFGFALLIAYLSNGNVDLIFYSSVGALLSALVIGKAERLTAFLWAAVALVVGNSLVMLAISTANVESAGVQGLVSMLIYAVLNSGLSVSIALIGFFVLGNLFGILTSLQLMELSRPTHPLLRQLLLKAPGTYHHTILVSNLAERAAEAIHADAYLSRVGAYYHDIGKTVRPYFFTENIADETSPHTNLDPKTSAQIIISHVKDGVDLAKKYRLPEALQDFIWQHHGAQVMSFFYQKAREEADDPESVRQEDFAYPGPDPQTKEAAIMMLADVCEAAIRAERPATRQALEDLVNKLITQRVLDGSLRQSSLTFGELETIKETFIQVLQGVHHPRIKYPNSDSRAETTDGEPFPAARREDPPSEPDESRPPQNGRSGQQADRAEVVR